jgi:hypothetical protein
MRTTLLLGCLHFALLAAAGARADARADVFALRHEQSPTAHTFLGWTPDGRAAFRWIVCSEGGERQCSAAVGTFGPGGARNVTPIFSYAGYDRVSTVDAMAFIRAERAALAALPPLTLTSPAPDGLGAFGDAGGTPTRIRARIVPTPALAPDGGLVRVAVHGAGRVRAELTSMGAAFTVSALAVDAFPSPDGRLVALALRAETTSMCWDFTDVAFVVADIADVHARLAP